MRYIKADYVFPEELLKEIQRYVHGELIYIPKMREERKNGEKKQAREYLDQRNAEISRKFSAGISIDKLSETFCLSYDSIKKIVYSKIQNNKGLEEKIILRSFLCILDYKLFYI